MRFFVSVGRPGRNRTYSPGFGDRWFTVNRRAYGAWREIRTPDLRLTMALLYRLSYPGVVPGVGFEPTKAYANGFTDRSIWPLWISRLEPEVRLELTTYPLQGDCSTTELLRLDCAGRPALAVILGNFNIIIRD